MDDASVGAHSCAPLPADRTSPAPPAIADFACQISLGHKVSGVGTAHQQSQYRPGIVGWAVPTPQLTIPLFSLDFGLWTFHYSNGIPSRLLTSFRYARMPSSTVYFGVKPSSVRSRSVFTSEVMVNGLSLTEILACGRISRRYAVSSPVCRQAPLMLKMRCCGFFTR